MTKKEVHEKKRKGWALFSAGENKKKYLGFKSSSSLESRLYLLSNFAKAPLQLTWPQDVEGVPRFLWSKTCKYKTSEHAYQALRAKDLRSAREFERGGVVNMKIFKRWPKKFSRTGSVEEEENVYKAKMKHWGLKGPGIAPKQIVSSPRIAMAFGIELSCDIMRQAHSFEEQLEIWRPILLAKFEQNDDAFDVLMSTVPHHLVEQDVRFPNKNSYWSAHMLQKTEDEVVLTGQNMFGRLLERVRDELHAKASRAGFCG